MKRFFLSLLVLFTAAGAHAQQAVPQGTLENWALRRATLAPTGWLTTDDLLAAVVPFPIPPSGTVTRTTASHGGMYAAQLTTSNVTGFGAVPGIIFLGTRFNLSSTGDIPVGVPYTSRPARMEFYYKLTGMTLAADSAMAMVQLTRTVNGNEQLIAQGQQYLLTAAPNYTLGNVPLTYQSNAQPDSLRLFFISGNADNITPGTTLTVDNVAMAGIATATRDAVAEAALSVYPSSSPDGRFTLAAPTQPALLSGAVRVTDALGRPVFAQMSPLAAGARTLDLHGQAPGVYVLRLETATGSLTRKLVVQ